MDKFFLFWYPRERYLQTCRDGLAVMTACEACNRGANTAKGRKPQRTATEQPSFSLFFRSPNGRRPRNAAEEEMSIADKSVRKQKNQPESPSCRRSEH